MASGTRGYSSYRGRGRKGKIFLAILLILIIGGFIMLSLGVIGHYIARIYEEVKGRPKYIISHVTENVPGTAVGSWKREHRESRTTGPLVEHWAVWEEPLPFDGYIRSIKTKKG